MSTRLAARVAVAVLVTAAAGLLPSGPAQAAGCSTASGVSVVVDFHELGGGVQQACDAGGAGQSAATQFKDGGFELTRVQKQPGFVCRVDQAPSSDPCVDTPPPDAYWGLWWSDGTSGRWTYASQGVDSLEVPSGGSVALSWNGSSGQHRPGVAPAVHPTSSPSPSPTHQPTQHPTRQPGHASSQPTQPPAPSPTGPAGGPPAAAPPVTSGSADPTASAGTTAGSRRDGRRHAGHRHRAATRPTASASPSASGPASAGATAVTRGVPTAGAPAPADRGLPTWVAPGVVALLFAAAGGTALLRRRRAAPHP